MKKSRKILALVLSLALVFALAACTNNDTPSGGDTTSPSPSASTPVETPDASKTPENTPAASDYAVAMITDYGDITDQSFNQTTYEACNEYCTANGVKFNYYKPNGDSTAERVAMVDAAVVDGYNVIVMPGYAFAETIKETAEMYPDVIFIALDVGEGDLGDYAASLPGNVYCAVYQEELCGYMAGYAAVKLGYSHLGFLGGMAVPAVVRYGYGFVQGADAAAAETGTDVTVEYVYGNQFFGDADITGVMDTWYQNLGVEAVFACGGGIYTSAAEAAAKTGGKVIGVDTDQSGIIDAYGEGMTVTSAMKGLAATVKTMLAEVEAGNFANHGGKIETLGLVSATDVESNYVQLPVATTQFNDNFTEADYVALVGKMLDGTVTVSNDTTVEPAANATTATVNSYGNIK
ncbi:BMP family lipoprotein [Lawsonibacter faecis]|uniref:BMP family ABC transporter substrate-binding protein n=1 Tax=Lawsonibacter faecis TaxID=2763052 RepID=A0A8J6MDU1_9FIRM|nr:MULTISPECIES: BMP family ABC transporter substrate-binding protein [Oscillospiraceae]MTQ96663.1 BMP family ABC transporter substrate-binding protein [Pseudoflavonifractor sp. BIOML-A16]MTR04900.1 BMP family ABC transporter substrate-binding protein [Pseudoflavonifractor sp. BIOML-A15]MTR30852.1 BMP family ABC transporter substrate-binding protein [Pseudoflavonifractor sp. BIOML-A14]MTR71915.1 BMP family ABC transporter substrate-binding protein [Pseudoflavonifractor sp. BIOML-A18]MTS63439.1